MERAETTIGTVTIPGPLVQAPLAGITDLPCRLIAKSLGAALVYNPLISAKALCLRSRKTFDLLVSDPAERPVAVQIFGGEPETIARAVAILNDYPFDMIDINMGCPVPKVARNEGGVALMRDVPRAIEVVAAAVAAGKAPVTVKMRSGWDAGSINAPELAAAVEEVGAAAIALHPRTKTQGFTGRADWGLIAETKRTVRIPVIGSGDVRTPEDVARMFEETGCDLVMIGRAGRGNPWIFRRTLDFLATGKLPPEPTPAERVQALVKHCTLSATYDTDRRAALRMRKHAAWYLRGLKNAAAARNLINHAQTIADIVEICHTMDNDWHTTCLFPHDGL
jgi:tRNA-dihydrouridine synthase B